MYIKLGTLNLQYYQDTNDWMIMAEVIDSSLSFENPVLVRTTDELDIWFGRGFSDYNYLSELIQSGIVLYLYKPTKTQTTGSLEDYIDLSRYKENNEIWLRDVELDWISEVVTDPEAWKFEYTDGLIVGFKINQETGKITSLTTNVEGRGFCTLERVRDELPVQIAEIYNTNPSFHVYDSEDLWIYYEGDILNTALLPQNINQTSTSLDNRDTLVLTSPTDPYKFVYLDYLTGEDRLGIYKDRDLVGQALVPDKTKLGLIDSEAVALGQQSLVFKFSGKGNNETDYLIIPEASSPVSLKLLYNNQSCIPSEVWNKYQGVSMIVDFEEDLTEVFRSFGYKIVKKDDSLYLFSNVILPVLWFYHSEDFIFSPETWITEKILSKYITPALEVTSKTIGRGVNYEEDLISITVEKGEEDETWRITIGRYDYTEIFEGTLKPEPGEERLDYKISSESKLIRMELTNGTELREGTFFLRGATIEEADPEMYNYSFDRMMSRDGVFPDFFLVPDKYKYISELDPGLMYFPIYEKFLDTSKEKGCQFLIENKSLSDLYTIKEVTELPNPIEEGVYYKIGDIYYDSEGNIVTDAWFLKIVNDKGDYTLNYITDIENRLVYFYRGMTYYMDKRPGYYAFLRGLLLGEYSISIKDISYNEPTEDAYSDFPIESSLEKYKSNYLVCNNLTYYYKKLQNGKTWDTSIWMRFVAGKISRELEKNQGKYIGQQLLGKIRSAILDLMASIQTSFSIIQSIEVTSFEPDTSGKLDLEIETYVNDLVDNNVKLGVTVNYNNTN